MRFKDNTSLAEFLTAAQRSPGLRDRLLTAIETDAVLRGAALLHAANDDRASDELRPRVNKFIDAMESGDPEKQDRALKGLDQRLHRELSNQGFGEAWILERMGAEED
jgi:hypothetical protein